MTFDDPASPYKDSSTNHITVTYEYVDVDPSLKMARFNGSGMINLYRFSNADFQQSLVIRLEFQDQPGGAEQQALVTNCIFSYQEEATISMIVDKKISAVIFGLETTDAKAEFIVPYTVGVSFTGDMNIYFICLNTSKHLYVFPFKFFFSIEFDTLYKKEKKKTNKIKQRYIMINFKKVFSNVMECNP